MTQKSFPSGSTIFIIAKNDLMFHITKPKGFLGFSCKSKLVCQYNPVGQNKISDPKLRHMIKLFTIRYNPVGQNKISDPKLRHMIKLFEQIQI